MKNETIDLGLIGYDDLFMTSEERADSKKPKVEEVSLSLLTPFKGHPFQVKDDEEMDRLKDSIRESGVLVPALARPTETGYELISGHRRMAACKSLGMETMPVIVREMTDAEAIITMVDSNLQREHILPSEKAFAYKMKMNALKKQGKRTDLTSSQIATRFNAAAQIGAATGESRDQIYRYIRLTNLIPALLKLVDDGRIAFSVAVELSYLDRSAQEHLADIIARDEATPSYSQAVQMHKENGLSFDGISNERVDTIMAEQKPNQKEQIRLRRDEFSKYFPVNYSERQIRADIIAGLDLLKRQRERSRARDTR